MTEREQEIEAREKAATKGPFVLPAYGNGLVAIVTKAGGLTRNVVADKVLLADADFFAHAHEDTSYLLAQLREAREETKATHDANVLTIERLTGERNEARGKLEAVERACKERRFPIDMAPQAGWFVQDILRILHPKEGE